MLNNRQVLRDKLLHLADEMPAEQLQEVIQFVDHLIAKKGQIVSDADPILVVAGTLTGDPPSSSEKRGWPSGYFIDIYGSTADDPLEEPDELPFETRETLHCGILPDSRSDSGVLGEPKLGLSKLFSFLMPLDSRSPTALP